MTILHVTSWENGFKNKIKENSNHSKYNIQIYIYMIEKPKSLIINITVFILCLYPIIV